MHCNFIKAGPAVVMFVIVSYTSHSVGHVGGTPQIFVKGRRLAEEDWDVAKCQVSIESESALVTSDSS